MTLTREQAEDLLNSLEERIAIPLLGYLNAQRAEIERLNEFITVHRDDSPTYKEIAGVANETVEQLRATVEGYQNSLDVLGREHDKRKNERDEAWATIARLRVALVWIRETVRSDHERRDYINEVLADQETPL